MKDKSSPITYDDVSHSHVYLFRLVGFYPRSDESPMDSCIIAFCHLTMIIYWSMHLGYEIRMVTQGSLEVEGVFESVLVHGLFLRYVLFQYNRDQLALLMKICEELWQRLIDDEGRIVKVRVILILERVLFAKFEFLKTFEKKVILLRHFFLWNTLIAIGFYVVTALFVKLPPDSEGGKERRNLAHKYILSLKRKELYQ